MGSPASFGFHTATAPPSGNNTAECEKGEHIYEEVIGSDPTHPLKGPHVLRKRTGLSWISFSAPEICTLICTLVYVLELQMCTLF